MPPETTVILRILIGTGLGFAIGFERGLRGSPAGDRTFSLIGGATAAIAAVAFQHSPQTVAGAVTGVGFIGGGVVFHREGTLVRGVTTVATVFVTAAIGVVVGSGASVAGVVLAALVLFVLEFRSVPFLRWLDSESYSDRLKHDAEVPTVNVSPVGPADLEDPGRAKPI